MNIANILTISRIVISPLVLLLFQCAGTPLSITMLSLLVVICAYSEISDILDGHLSRKFNTASDFGKLADPFADSIYHLTIFFCFAQQNWIPLWMPMILLYRDLIVSALRMHALNKNIIIGARGSGKIKAIIQGTCSIVILVLILKEGGETTHIASSIYALGLVAVFTTLWSAIDYSIGILKATT